MAQMKPSRPDFSHPFQPYDIQLQFMRDLYATIEDGKIGIFESPTGTGKSLSLICGSLTWLRDHKRRLLDEPVQTDEPGDDPEWIIEAERQERRRDVMQQREKLEARLKEVRRQNRANRIKLSSQSRPPKKPRTERSHVQTVAAAGLETTEFLPDDYDSDESALGNSVSTTLIERDDFSVSTKALLQKLTTSKSAQDDALVSKETRIIFCSRTHSQLTQFIKELRRVNPPPSITALNENGVDEVPASEQEVVKHLCLGSRKNLCINRKVSQLNSVAAINERCLDLQKPGVSEAQKCSFLPKKENLDVVDSFRDHALAEIHDIEDLGNLGRSMRICPYYASRAAIESTEILTLPYPLLLQKSAREALGVSIKDHIVIIDEAHNLMDAIADTYSCSISLAQLDTATSQVMLYAQKFKNRLKGKNRVYITQIIRLLNSISGCLRSIASNTHDIEAIVTSTQLLAGKGVDQIQPHKLIRYLQDSKLAHKVEDYFQSTDDKAAKETSTSSHRGALQLFQSFLAVLTNPSAEGRFFFSKDEEGHLSVRYALLDPREHFRDIVEDSRAVILAGGTMSPMSDYKDYLFSYISPARLQTFSFGHVVPPENIFAHALSTGPSGVSFDFSFEKRKSEQMLIELGLLFIRVCHVIPDGVVAFFPSYDFLTHVVAVWKKTSLPAGFLRSGGTSTQHSTNIFSALNAVKPIFHENKPKSFQQTVSGEQPKSSEDFSRQSAQNPSLQESLLQSYSRTIDQSASEATTSTKPPKPNGALLLSVISGTLSEGINFSDKLGRAVIAIGLPYPNPHSAIWKAKFQHVEAQYLKTHPLHHKHESPSTGGKAEAGTGATRDVRESIAAKEAAKTASREFYTNTTLRAVNQAIGRAIRHRNDYAAILLVDRRWESASVREKLPAWIAEVLDQEGGEGESVDRPAGSRQRRAKDWPAVEKGLLAFFDKKKK